MRTLTCITFLMAVFSMNVSAVEPIEEQQIMLYYQIPLGGVTPEGGKHRFGLRFDQVTHAPGQDVPLGTLERKTAAMDFRMGYDGIRSLKINGVDYASYLIARAAADEQAEAETAATPDAGTAPAGEEAGAETTEAPQEEKTVVQQKLDELPFGVVIGVLLGIGIIAGVGG